MKYNFGLSGNYDNNVGAVVKEVKLRGSVWKWKEMKMHPCHERERERKKERANTWREM
jgi:hypothetical protein